MIGWTIWVAILTFVLALAYSSITDEYIIDSKMQSFKSVRYCLNVFRSQDSCLPNFDEPLVKVKFALPTFRRRLIDRFMKIGKTIFKNLEKIVTIWFKWQSSYLVHSVQQRQTVYLIHWREGGWQRDQIGRFIGPGHLFKAFGNN